MHQPMLLGPVDCHAMFIEGKDRRLLGVLCPEALRPTKLSFV